MYRKALPARIPRLLAVLVISAFTAMPSFCGDTVFFCAAATEPAVPLGMHSYVTWVVWNRSSSPIEYWTKTPDTVLRYDRGPVCGHEPPSFSLLGPGEIVVRAVKVPGDHGFTASLLGNHIVRVETHVKSPGEDEVIQEAVPYALVDEPHPNGFTVKTDWAWHSGKKEQVWLLESTDSTAAMPVPSLMATPYEWDMDTYYRALREWFDQPSTHAGFGESHDWINDFGQDSYMLFEDLSHLIAGEYRYTEMEYRIRYEFEHEARISHGLSPYFATKHAIHVFRTEGRERALEYLDQVESDDWNCVEQALRRYVILQIAGWVGDDLPRGLVNAGESGQQ